MLWSGTFPTYWRDGSALTVKWDAAQADVLAAVQQITQPLPPTSCTTSGSISLMDSDEASVTGAQGGSSSATRKRQVVHIKPLPRSVSNNTQELRWHCPTKLILHPLPGHITQIGVTIYLPHLSDHILHLIVINPSLS